MTNSLSTHGRFSVALPRPACPQGAVRLPHGPLLFSALKAAMAEPGRAADPLLAREYSKLFTAASKVAEVRGGATSFEFTDSGFREPARQSSKLFTAASKVAEVRWGPFVVGSLARDFELF